MDELDTDLIKPWYTSKRVLGLAAAAIQGILMVAFGVELTDAETTQLVNLLLGGGTTIAAGVAFYGVVTAKHKVAFKKPTTPPDQPTQ